VRHARWIAGDAQEDVLHQIERVIGRRGQAAREAVHLIVVRIEERTGAVGGSIAGKGHDQRGSSRVSVHTIVKRATGAERWWSKVTSGIGYRVSGNG
jgi:hypothetical protein